jgi:hypothetical protein
MQGIASLRVYQEGGLYAKEENRRRAMAGERGYATIGPRPSWAERVAAQVRSVPRRINRALQPETAGETAGLVAASMVPGVGEGIDIADIIAGARTGDIPRMGWGAAGLALPLVAGSTLRRIAQRGAKVADELAMDEVSRIARRKDWLAPSRVKKRVYHATTHEIDAFEIPRTEESVGHHGRAVYFSDSPKDVGANYASSSNPDLMPSSPEQMKRIQDEFFTLGGRKGEPLRELLDPDTGEILYEGSNLGDAMEVARKRVVGPHQGAIIPAHIDLRNPVDVRPGGTYFKSAGRHYGDDYLSKDSIALERITDIMMDEGRRAGVPIENLEEFLDEIGDAAFERGGMSAEALEDIIRGPNSEIFDGIDASTGEAYEAVDRLTGGYLHPGEFLRKVYQRLGFDGTIVDAQKQWGEIVNPDTGEILRRGMGNVEGATHYAVFDPAGTVRSPWAAFDPSKAGSADLSAGIAGLLGLGAAGAARRNYVEREQ